MSGGRWDHPSRGFWGKAASLGQERKDRDSRCVPNMSGFSQHWRNPKCSFSKNHRTQEGLRSRLKIEKGKTPRIKYHKCPRN